MRMISFSVLAFFFSLAAGASDCVPQSEMAEIAGHFPQFRNLANKDFCYDGGQDSHLISGIEFMRKTQFSKGMARSSDELFSGTFASDWWGYFIGRISNFQVDTNCPKGVAAYVMGFGGDTMYVCSAALTDNFTSLDLASVFMHEARHMDGFPHITCSHGARQGLPGACDSRISDAGSYAVTVETYAQLAKYATDVHPALKAYARSAAVIYADEAFENPVQIKRKERFLVMTNDRSIRKLNLDGTSQVLGTAPELGHVVMRGQHMILFPDDVNNRARFLFARSEGEVPTLPGNQAEEYNALPPASRSSMVDIHIGAQWNARVYKTKVRFDCDPRSANTQELVTSDVPVGLLYPSGYERSSRMAHLMTESGKVLELGCNGTRAYMKDSALTLDMKYKSLYKVGALVLGLTMDGSLREVTGSSSKPYSLGKGVDGNVHEIMPNQSLEFFEEN